MLTIGDAQSFSSIVSIAPSRGFSGGTLIEVWLCHGRLSQIEEFLSWKMEYSDSYITVMRTCYEKGGCCGRQTCIIDVGKAISL